MTTAIYHRQVGSGEPLIAIHGLFGSIENLGMITRLLKGDVSVYSLDLPNHGRSLHIDKVTLPIMAKVIVEWMDAQQIQNAHFLGHSLGGKVAMEIALRFPERVNKLVVADIAPVAYERRHDDVLAGFAAVDLASIKSRKEADIAMAEYVPEIAVRSFLLKNLEQVEGRWQWRINLDGLSRSYENLIAGNSTSLAPANAPTLFIKGERSNYILPEHKDAILRLFPRASVKVIADTEHWLHAEKPDIFSGIVKRFLNR